MNRLITALALIISFTSFASWSPPDSILQRSVEDPTLEEGQAAYTFFFQNFCDTVLRRRINYDVDGVGSRAWLDSDYSLTVVTTAGMHDFYFEYFGNVLACNNYYYSHTDSLKSTSGYRNEYHIYFEDLSPGPPPVKISIEKIEQPVLTYKPVIYLYPEETTEIEVDINIHGDNPFFYPTFYDNWKLTADSDGTLHIRDEEYNYLFWEATHYNKMTPEQLASGFVMKGENAIEFLEEKLTAVGLNSKEQADFITFWGPMMQQHETNFVHFIFNEECNELADLTITPKPDNVYRIYMLWAPVEPGYQAQEQKLLPFDRSGFSVLEWGGQKHIIQTPIN